MSKINNTRDELEKTLEATKVKKLDDTADSIRDSEASTEMLLEQLIYRQMIHDDTGNTVSLSVDRSVNGIGLEGDKDFFKIRLEADQPYSFNVKSITDEGGPHPQLAIYDQHGDLIEMQGDSITVAEAGDYLIVVNLISDNDIGAHKIKKVIGYELSASLLSDSQASTDKLQLDQPLKEIEDNVDQLKKDLEYIDLQLKEIENENQSKEASGSWEEEPFTFISSNIYSSVCNYFEPVFAEIAKDPSKITKDPGKISYSDGHDAFWEAMYYKTHYKNDSTSYSEHSESLYANDGFFSSYANRYSNYNDDFCFI